MLSDRDPDAGRHREDLAAVLELDRLAQDLGQAVGERVERTPRRRSPRPASRTRRHRADPPCPARAPRPAAVSRRSCRSWSPAACPRLSLTCLKPSMSMNSAPATIPGWRADPREQLLGAVEHEGAVGKAGERVVQRLVGAARGSSRARARAPACGRFRGPASAGRSPRSGAFRRSAARASSSCRTPRPRPWRPNVCTVHPSGSVDHRALRSRRGGAACECDVRGALAVAEGDGHVRVTLERPAQHDARARAARRAIPRRRAGAPPPSAARTPPRYTGVSTPSVVVAPSTNGA